jgi:hypoxanthine phosphoribosyltransferase
VELLITALGIILAILGIIFSGPIWQRFHDRWFRYKGRISWNDFFAKLRDPRVLSAIVKDGRKPDIIIGVNSGIVPAAIIAFNYEITRLFYLSTMPAYDKRGHRIALDIDLSGINIEGKYVLIVDDQYVSGETMRIVRDAVEELPGAETAVIKTFAVYAHDTPTRPISLDIQPPGRVSTLIPKAPWIFSATVDKHYLERSRKEDVH